MVALFLVVSLPIAFSKTYYVEIHTCDSILRLEALDKSEAFEICSYFIDVPKVREIVLFTSDSPQVNYKNPYYCYVPKIPQLAPEVMEDTSAAPYRTPLYCIMPKRREEDLSTDLYPLFRRYRKGQYCC